MKRATAIALGLVAFVFRLLSSADLSNDHYMQMAWAQQLLFGELPGRDFVDPGMPLAYMLSALAQWVRPGPFTELFLCAALMGVAAAVTFTAASWLANSPVVGVAATLLEIGLQPRFYSYPKILVPAAALLLFQAYARRQTVRRLAAVGIWTGVAGLLRHDLAVYAAFGIGAGLVNLHWTDRRLMVRRLFQYSVAAALTLAPYAVLVMRTEGIAEHLRRGLEFAKAESHQRVFDLPSLAGAGDLPWARDAAAGVLFYAAYGTVLAAVTLLIARRGRGAEPRTAAAVAATATLAAYLVVILRYPLDARLPDIAAVLTLALAWIGGQALAGGRETDERDMTESNPDNEWGHWARDRGQAEREWGQEGSPQHGHKGRKNGIPVRRWAGIAAAVFAFVLIAHAVWVLGSVREAIDNTGISGGLGDVVETYTDLNERGSVWPWARSWPNRELPPVVRYLNACTKPSDAVLLTWPAPEYGFFARRRFAAGHAEFLPPRAFTTDRDQAQMLHWLGRQQVPVVLINEGRRKEFAAAYPKVDAYLTTHYTATGRFDIYDGSSITLGIRNGLSGTRTWSERRWPCGLSQNLR